MHGKRRKNYTSTNSIFYTYSTHLGSTRATFVAVRVELCHISVASLAHVVALLSRQSESWQRKVGEDPHRRRLGLLARSAKVLMIDISHLW